MKKKRGEVSL
uniref:Uncharacterized protein n=1 Tax=Rhizophora mucronata TaxID=61149 RepID=A0A2P2QW42_RHIMU